MVVSAMHCMVHVVATCHPIVIRKLVYIATYNYIDSFKTGYTLCYIAMWDYISKHHAG